MLESSLTASVRLSDEQQTELNRHKRAVRINNEKYFRCHPVLPRRQKRPHWRWPSAAPAPPPQGAPDRPARLRMKGLATGRPATASGARATRHFQSRRAGFV